MDPIENLAEDAILGRWVFSGVNFGLALVFYFLFLKGRPSLYKWILFFPLSMGFLGIFQAREKT